MTNEAVMSLHSALKELAQLAISPPYSGDAGLAIRAARDAMSDFNKAATPYAVLALIEENERLRGIKPEIPPFPSEGDGMPRYGIRWKNSHSPLAVPMDDGYWTPHHLAENQIQLIREKLKAAQAENLRVLRIAIGTNDEFQIVPTEPTLEMIAALGFDGDIDLAIGHAAISVNVAEAYKQALLAAPKKAIKHDQD